MSVIQETQPTQPNPASAPGGVRMPSRLPATDARGIPFSRLVAVEARKLIDTRSGRWLLVAISALTLLVVGIVMFTGDKETGLNFTDFLLATIIPQSFLLPILGIMAVTSEWSQRTGLVTFTLEPKRVRVAMSKLSAVMITGFGVVVLGAVLAAICTFAAQVVRGSDPSWSVSGRIILGIVVGQLIGLGMGFAFGALIQNTPGAIVAYLFIPIVWSIAASISWMKPVGEWADTNQTMNPLFDDTVPFGGTEVAKLAVSLVIWIVIPLTLGLIRMVRNEVKSA